MYDLCPDKMHKLRTYLLLFTLLATAMGHASQGLVLPHLLPDSIFDHFDEAGSDFTAEQIYDNQHASLKDQVVYLSNGHSGVLLSENGLLLTNYTPFLPFINGRDSLQHGFAATDSTQEIPLSNLYALQLIKSENISQRIYDNLPATNNEQQRQQAIDSICQQVYLEQAVIPGHLLQIECLSNQEYYLYEYNQYSDIRLVYLPDKNLATAQNESSIARYKADFCLLRLYTSRDNVPAAYSEFNIPARQMAHATISRISKQENDPVFYLGYPNSSQRSLLSEELHERLAGDSAKITIWQFLHQHHQAETKEQQQAVLYEHQLLQRMQLASIQQQKEMAFTTWAASNERFEIALRYGNTLPFLYKTYATRRHHWQQYHYNAELFKNVSIVHMGFLLLDMNAQNEAITLQQISQLFGKLQTTDEKAWLTTALEYYKTLCDTTYMPDVYAHIDKKYKGNTAKYVDYVFKKSFMTDEKRFTKYLDEPTEQKRQADPLLQLCSQLKNIQRLHYLLYLEHDPIVERGKRMYQEGLRLQNPPTTMPEANYTLRFGFGYIQGYQPNGNTQVPAFAYLHDRDKGSYLYTPLAPMDSSLQEALQNDTICSDFLTTCDAPVGRMGHALFNAHGELLGIMSGVNPEAEYNTYLYDATYQRTLVSSIDYLVFLLEHSEADYLVDEMHFGDPEQLVQIEYINTPAPLPRPDSIQVNDSLKIAINDSLLNDSAFIAQYDSLLRTFSWYNDSTFIAPADSIASSDSTAVASTSDL